jgi:hypothetical protein
LLLNHRPVTGEVNDSEVVAAALLHALTQNAQRPQNAQLAGVAIEQNLRLDLVETVLRSAERARQIMRIAMRVVQPQMLGLRDKAIKPLLAAAQELIPTRGGQHPRAIDRHYQDLRLAMQGVFHELGIAA